MVYALQLNVRMRAAGPTSSPSLTPDSVADYALFLILGQRPTETRGSDRHVTYAGDTGLSLGEKEGRGWTGLESSTYICTPARMSHNGGRLPLRIGLRRRHRCLVLGRVEMFGQALESRRT
jgi:hypothetical protein